MKRLFETNLPLGMKISNVIYPHPLFSSYFSILFLIFCFICFAFFSFLFENKDWSRYRSRWETLAHSFLQPSSSWAWLFPVRLRYSPPYNSLFFPFKQIRTWRPYLLFSNSTSRRNIARRICRPKMGTSKDPQFPKHLKTLFDSCSAWFAGAVRKVTVFFWFWWVEKKGTKGFY